MIIVHDIFICKPGNASKFAKLFKEVMATKYDSLSAYEKSFEKYMHDTDEMKKMKEK